MKFIDTFIFLVVLLVACDQQPVTDQVNTQVESDSQVESPAVSENTIDYIFERIEGSDIQMAMLKDALGNVTESGPMLNGQKTGTWVQNHVGTNLPAKIISYVDGIYNGIYLEVNDRGQHELMAYYKNNKLHGSWAKMRFGKPEISANYHEGELDGLYKEFDFRNGKIKKEVPFKNGKENGTIKFYDEEGSVTVEYEYKDGEKVSGGIVD